MPADPLEGRNLGKYRVLEPLGRGGMARVYRAYHPQLDRYAAIKVLRPDLVDDGEFLTRFRQEAQAVAALRHPNIVRVFDFEADVETPFMAMELLEGDTLRTRLNDYRQRGERMPDGEAVRILLDVLAGLAYAHSEGMIHRDVKPANILLSQQGQAVLTDFGVAQIVGGTRHTITGVLMGTLHYMAPEQGLEGVCDARSDVYSLGIVFYEMLTGGPPFDAETPLAILMKHVNDPLPLPRQSDPSILEPLERVVLKALAKRPDDRYQSAEAMAQALEKVCQESRLELPERVSLPLSFTTADAPSESVVVLSGTARARISDVGFAREDTDETLGRRLAAEAADSLRLDGTPPARNSLGKAIVRGVLLVAIGNLLVVMAGLMTGWWGVFGRGWPFELLAVGLALSTILGTTESIWLLVPTGIVLGNGYLMAYSSLTGLWYHWRFLWPLELVVVLGTVGLCALLADQKERSRALSRQVAQAVSRPVLLTIGVVVLVGAIVG